MLCFYIDMFRRVILALLVSSPVGCQAQFGQKRLMPDAAAERAPLPLRFFQMPFLG